MNILLTSVGRRSYLVKYFKMAVGKHGKVHVSNSSDITPAFKIADKSVVTPLIYDPNYIPFLLSYCKKNKIDVLISLFDIDLPILSQKKNLFKDIGVNVIISDENVINICNDKLMTNKFLQENKFNVPKTYFSLENILLDLNKKEIDYPLIIKPRWGMGSIGILQADNEEELKIFYQKSLNQIKNSYLKYESSENLDESIIIQEKLNGQEYGLDIINDLSGNYQNTIVKIKHAMRSGETDCAEVVENNLLKNIGKRISEKLKHIGNLDVDVFLVDDKAYILEMNARFGGGYPFSHIAGVDLPKAIVSWINKEEVSKSLLTEKVGILAHKDIEIVKINDNKINDDDILVADIKEELNIFQLLNEFNNVFDTPISDKVLDLEIYSKKLKENACVYVLKNVKNNINLGFIVFYSNNKINNTAYISFLGIKAEYRKFGIGKKLLDLCLKKAKNENMQNIKLEVQNSNINAIKFYLNNGYNFLEKCSENSVYMIKKI